MRQWQVIVAAACLMAGCSSSRESAGHSGAEERTGERPRTFPGTHLYHVMNDSCACEQYKVTDPRGPVAYSISASYEIEEAITTTIHLEVRNNSADTVQTSMAYVKVTSRHVAYQYSNRSVPLTMEAVPPHEERKVTLLGTSVKQTEDPWLALAGEELTVTVQGLTVGRRHLAPQVFRMVPQNPRFAD